MTNFLSTLIPGLARFTAGLAEKNPRTTAWGTLGLGILGVLGYAPEQVRGVLMTVANFFAGLANMIPV